MIETLGRYKILSVIGQGAMGVVYKAVDPVIDREVAIKTINLSLNNDEIAEYEVRFQQEIKAAGRLNHPNIVTIFDVGKNETVAYMAMELLDGKELKDILMEGGRPSVLDTVDWLGQIAGGLAAAHDQHIIHRDVKPSNIMIVRGGYAKITDFGIARMNASAVKTMTGLILGSPRYMSPEQVIGKSLDSRTDIFSLGVVLYEALTSSPPFDGDNVNAIMYATVNHRQVPPSSLNSDVPPMLDLIVAKALAKSVDERYQSMRDMVQDLAEVKRLLQAAAPAGKVIATKSPPPSKPAALDALGVGVGRYKKEDDEPAVAPLALAKKFDSFDATLKLAAMTQQTPEFESYISETKKMRAYTGDTSGLDQRAASVKAALSPNASVESATVPMAQLEEMELAAMAYAAKQAAKNGTDLDLTEPNPPLEAPGLPIGLIVVVAGLALAAVVLLVALFA
ncbi:MAG: serine/threonine protein kinase [Burkholderiales bacterium]|jgi:serine/threonine protein kinase|nr:serine/threonine protein kinase [Nitrosomonadaceae bacterium]